MKVAPINTMIEQLCEDQFAIVDNFLSPKDYEALYQLALESYADGKFNPARIGRGLASAEINAIRRDEIYWIDNTETNPAITTYCDAIQNLIQKLNEALFIGLSTYEVHFAIYHPGDFYKKHIDQFKNNATRQISCVYYLNPDWQQSDGGALQLYDTENTPLTRVLPQGNRFVCFRSHLPHEVLVTNKIRYSLTGWLKTTEYR